MMKKLAYILTFMLFCVVSCTNSDDNPEGDILLRIKNTSNFTYNNIVVNTGGGEHTYGTLQPGETSSYKPYMHAYSYAFVELEIDGQTYTIQPIDYVGESQLPNGKYTYEIGADDSENNQYSKLSINLVKD